MSQHMELSGYTTVDPGRKREKAFSISVSHRREVLAPEWQRGQLSARGCRSKEAISQHNSQEETKTREVLQMEAVSANVAKRENSIFCN